MGILEQEMKRLAQQAGGSHKTVYDRIKLAQIDIYGDIWCR